MNIRNNLLAPHIYLLSYIIFITTSIMRIYLLVGGILFLCLDLGKWIIYPMYPNPTPPTPPSLSLSLSLSLCYIIISQSRRTDHTKTLSTKDIYICIYVICLLWIMFAYTEIAINSKQQFGILKHRNVSIEGVGGLL